MPEPSGRRTSITTRSGSNRSAAAMASATVPAWATTWKFVAAIEGGDDALPDHLVVIDDQHPPRGRPGRPATGRRAGSRSVGHASDPPVLGGDRREGARSRWCRCPVTLLTSSVPPIDGARARMLPIPWWPGLSGRGHGSKPRPSSAIRSSSRRRRHAPRDHGDALPRRMSRGVAERLAGELEHLSSVGRVECGLGPMTWTVDGHRACHAPARSPGAAARPPRSTSS